MRSNGFKTRYALALPLSAALSFPLTTAHASTGNGQTRTVVNQGVTISKDADLLFGDFSAGSAQSRFRLDPDSGSIIQLSGNALSLGGTRTAASFTALGTPLATVRLTVSQNQIDLVRVNGTEKMRVDQFRLDGGNGTRNRTVNASGSVTYKLGGRLTINPGQAAGAYVGSFNVNIDYQ